MALPGTLPGIELLYGFIAKQLSVLVTTQVQRACTSYLSRPVTSSTTAPPSADPDAEREVDLLQMDRLLKWMELVFDDSMIPETGDGSEAVKDTHRAYKQELFSIYRTLCSDYQQYRRWKQYNQSIWFFSSYRRQDTASLARKLLSDVRLFKEGLHLLMVLGSPYTGTP